LPSGILYWTVALNPPSHIRFPLLAGYLRPSSLQLQSRSCVVCI
jgi:hypothetical protein